MLMDGILITSPQGRSLLSSPLIASFLAFIERRLNVMIVRDTRTIPYGRAELASGMQIAHLLTRHGVIQSLHRVEPLPDEPPIKRWTAICNDAADHTVSGASAESAHDGLFATLGEALERFLWTEATDHFRSPVRATVSDIRSRGTFVDPSRFAGFGQPDRDMRPELALHADATYLWVQAISIISGEAVYVPAQTVSGHREIRVYEGKTEPLIRLPITTGVATWNTLEGARLRGALEVIERDAYMITWLNQITPPRIALSSFRAENSPLSRLISRCERYGLRPHILRLVTDAPTYALACVLEDMSGHAPRFTLGLKARSSLNLAIEGALIEAIRARPYHRVSAARGETWDSATPAVQVGHYDRLNYWAVPEHARGLEFLLKRPETEPVAELWDRDTEQEHLTRITAWCAGRGYECVSVSLGTSKKNPLPWHTEVVVIPQLQPTHLYEKIRQVYGERVHSVPLLLGFPARSEPFIDAPHPFA